MIKLSPIQKAILSILQDTSDNYWCEKIARKLKKAASNMNRSVSELMKPTNERGALIKTRTTIGITKILELTDEGKEVCEEERIGSDTWEEIVGS